MQIFTILPSPPPKKKQKQQLYIKQQFHHKKFQPPTTTIYSKTTKQHNKIAPTRHVVFRWGVGVSDVVGNLVSQSLPRHLRSWCHFFRLLGRGGMGRWIHGSPKTRCPRCIGSRKLPLKKGVRKLINPGKLIDIRPFIEVIIVGAHHVYTKDDVDELGRSGKSQVICNKCICWKGENRLKAHCI